MFRVLDPLQLAVERLWNNRVLVLWALVGLTAATTLALSLPLYVDSVDSRLLSSQLQNPPYAFLFRYLGSWNGNIKSDEVKSATAQIDGGFVNAIGLPVSNEVNFTRGGAWSTKLSNGKILGPFSIGSLQGADSQILITQGKWPPGPVKSGDPIPVLVPDKMLFSMGIQLGDKLVSTSPTGKAINLQVVALWAPIDANDPTWIFTPKYFDEILLVQPADLSSALASVDNPVEES